MEISFSSYSVTDHYIATKFGTCHDSPAVVSCAKYCSDHFVSIWMRAKWNFHHIWIVMEKLLVKWAPVPHFLNSSPLVTHVCVGERGQHWFGSWLVACSAPSITLTNADLLSIGPLWMNVCEILIEIQIFSMKKMHMKIAPGKMCFYWGGEYKV